MTGIIDQTSAPTEQIPLFDERLPRKPYCTDDLATGLVIRPAATARGKRYIQANPPWLRTFLIFDVDRRDGAIAWDEADLPLPYWNAINPVNGHAHTCYALDAPVLLGDHDREAPMRYLAAVESALTAKLQADPGYAGLVTKNPEHAHWRTLKGGAPLDLAYLSEFLPDLNKHKPKRGKRIVCAIGRNVETFDTTRLYSYGAIREWRRRGFVRYQAHLQDRAQIFTGECHPTPLDHRECYHIARSIGRWTWKRFTDAGFSQWQANAGRRSGAARRARNADRDAAWQAAHAAGVSMRAIAREYGVDHKTVAWALRRVGNEPYQIEPAG